MHTKMLSLSLYKYINPREPEFKQTEIINKELIGVQPGSKGQCLPAGTCNVGWTASTWCEQPWQKCEDHLLIGKGEQSAADWWTEMLL